MTIAYNITPKGEQMIEIVTNNDMFLPVVAVMILLGITICYLYWEEIFL